MKEKELQGTIIGLTCVIAALYREHPNPLQLAETLKRIVSERIENEPDAELSGLIVALETSFREGLNR